MVSHQHKSADVVDFDLSVSKALFTEHKSLKIKYASLFLKRYIRTEQ